MNLRSRYQQTRNFSRFLCEPLKTEDYIVQSMPDVSPTRWHLAHTSWFFETFLLARQPGYQPAEPAFEYLFNSYYNTVGRQFPRAQRGLLTRPTVEQVFAYRETVDGRMEELLAGGLDEQSAAIVELGIHHEQQHQELMLTDLKHVFSCNPLYPVYRDPPEPRETAAGPLEWQAFDGGLIEIGHAESTFAFDNERPRHRVWLEPFQLSHRLATNAEYLDFVSDGGYSRPELWLSLGWNTLQAEGWQAPLYWTQRDGDWHEFTLHGLRPLDPQAPVCHLSLFEADAFARWSEARLPTEAEWEHAAGPVAEGNFVEQGHYHPVAEQGSILRQMYGDVWEWTSSSYSAYPGYRPPPGALGEYNGKFMCNQYVLRGGSCGTSRSHIRRTYRNFFPPEARWQFSGVRLARGSAA